MLPKCFFVSPVLLLSVPVRNMLVGSLVAKFFRQPEVYHIHQVTLKENIKFTVVTTQNVHKMWLNNFRMKNREVPFYTSFDGFHNFGCLFCKQVQWCICLLLWYQLLIVKILPVTLSCLEACFGFPIATYASKRFWIPRAVLKIELRREF